MSANTPSRFVICGEALFDLFVAGEPPMAATSFELTARAGGSPFNVARSLARLGSEVSLLGGLSNDLFGERLATILAEDRVSTKYLVRKARRTTIALVQTDSLGSPQYVFYGSGGADRAYVTADLPDDLGDVFGIHFGSYSLVRDPVCDSLLSLARREHGRRLISLDLNVRPAIDPREHTWRIQARAFGPLSDIVKVSTEDIGFLYWDLTADEVAQGWLGEGIKLVVITDGANGATAWTAKRKVQVPAFPVEVADTVGAGDCFQAALLHEVSRHCADDLASIGELTESQLEDLLRFAAATAAIVCTRAGADPPRKEEVEEFLTANVA